MASGTNADTNGQNFFFDIGFATKLGWTLSITTVCGGFPIFLRNGRPLEDEVLAFRIGDHALEREAAVQRGSGHRIVCVHLDGRPALARGMLTAEGRLILDRAAVGQVG